MTLKWRIEFPVTWRGFSGPCWNTPHLQLETCSCFSNEYQKINVQLQTNLSPYSLFINYFFITFFLHSNIHFSRPKERMKIKNYIFIHSSEIFFSLTKTTNVTSFFVSLHLTVKLIWHLQSSPPASSSFLLIFLQLKIIIYWLVLFA